MATPSASGFEGVVHDNVNFEGARPEQAAGLPCPRRLANGPRRVPRDRRMRRPPMPRAASRDESGGLEALYDATDGGNWTVLAKGACAAAPWPARAGHSNALTMAWPTGPEGIVGLDFRRRRLYHQSET